MDRHNITLSLTLGVALVGAAALAFLTSGLVKLRRKHMMLKKIVKKRASASETLKIVKERIQKDIDLQKVESIVSLTFSQLQDKLRLNELTAVEVLHAYQWKALEVNSRINCITEAITEAEEMAAACDTVSSRERLLQGIPFSVKESIGIKGYDTTGGMQINITKPCTEDSVVVEVFKRHGAVPFIKTNVPQSLYSYACSNPIFGTSKNPHNTRRTTGGSSGGEGGIIAAGGSIMGLGTDLGGSVRVPAGFCGICALKPTLGRFSKKGVFTVNPGQTVVAGVLGPMAKDVGTLVMMTRVLASLDMSELDPTLPHIPFDENIFKSKHKLRIGYYAWDGNLSPLPVVVRAVKEAKAALESLGHTLVEFIPPDYQDIYPTLFVGCLVGGDQNRTLREKLKGDILDEGLKIIKLSRLPRAVIEIIAMLQTKQEPVLGKIIKNLKSDGTTYSWFRHTEKIQAYIQKFLQQWKSLGLDAVICPVFPSPAPLLEDIGKLTAGGSGCALYNLINFPAGTVPITRVSKQDIVDANNPVLYPAIGKLEQLLKKTCSSEGSEGLPVGVQCVTLPYKEELCLRLMKELEMSVSSGPK